MIALRSKNGTTPIGTICKQHEGLVNVKGGGTHNDHGLNPLPS